MKIRLRMWIVWCVTAALWLAVAGGAAAAQVVAQGPGEPPIPPMGVQAETPEQPLVSNIFVETFITQALQDIALQAGVNILADPGVQGFVTLELDEVPLEQALQLVLAPGGFTYVKLDPKTYLVGKADRSSPIFSELTQSRLVRLDYVTADQARRLLSEYYTNYVRFDAETNTALITAPAGLLERIAEDLARIDQPVAQVAIEALVTVISDEGRKDLGLDWSVLHTPDDPPENQRFGAGFNDLLGSTSVLLQTPYTLLQSTLRQMVSDGKASIRANPRLTVLDGGTAQIFVGEDRYFKIVTGTESTPFTRLEAINVGVSLSISPRVAANGEITLTVRPTVSDVTGQVGDDLPVVSRREITTTVRVRDGETLALGGLVQQGQETVTSRIPILGDLPLLRFFFSSTRERQTSSEVIVFITPRLVDR